MSRIHRVDRGTGTPKDRDKVNRLIDERFTSVMGECVTLK
jgi:hypothetical protein